MATEVSSAAAKPARTAASESIPNRPRRDGPYLTLLVRRAIKERHLDVSRLVGTGAGGRIRRDDLPQAPPSPSGADASRGHGTILTMTMEWDVSALRRRNDPAGSLEVRYAVALRRALHQNSALPDSIPVVVSSDDGYLSATPELVAPSSAALSGGAPHHAARVRVIDGQEAISIGWVVTATLAYDPRILAGEGALGLLSTIRDELADAG